MLDPFNKLAKILRIQPEVLLNLENKMSSIAGHEGIIEKIIEENDLLVERTLAELGLSRDSSAQEVRRVLQARLTHLDSELYKVLGRPDLNDMQDVCGRLCEKAVGLVGLVGSSPSTSSGQSQTTGFFIKKEKAIELLEKYPPQNLLDFFGYQNVRELIEKESFESVFAALRFTQSTEWMHKFFDEAYNELKAGDFEERPIQLKVLEEKWLSVAEKFLEKKYHNVSHLKELGIIFIVPLKLDPIRGTDTLRALAASNGAGTPGEILRIFTLILHYLNEVPFYSKLFREFSGQPDFTEKLKSLLRGDVLEGSLPDSGKITWRIVQRYLAKDNENDPRLFEPHVNPEAEHWYKAQDSLAKLGPDYSFWKGLDFVGDYFRSNPSAKAQDDQSELVSFDLIDVVMTLVKKDQIKYLYHQQEALWNKIFIEYMGRDRMNKLIEENIIKGYIEL